MLSNGQLYLKLNLHPTFLAELQSELYRLFDGIILKNINAQKIDEIGFLVPIQSILSKEYPTIYFLLNQKNLRSVMNENFFRFLFTDPNQFDPDTPSKKLDRYYPHIDKNGPSKIPAGSLNIPVINCDENTILNWHELNESELKKVVHFDWVDILYETSEKSVVDSLSMNMDSAYLIRTDKFHSVVNQSRKKRVIFGWHIRPNITWLKVKDLLLKKDLFQNYEFDNTIP